MIDKTQIETFVAQRPRLIRLAYRYLGSVTDAEDVVQDAWLRFTEAKDVRSPPAFLSTIVTRLCLDRLKSAAYNREEYWGPWLPEPLVDPFSPGEEAALDISFAVMRSLETLTPEERAAFFLHDLFDMPFVDIAKALDKTPQACCKLAQRARERVQAGRRRFLPDAARLQTFLDAFQTAMETSDHSHLRALLAKDAECISDGGGKVLAARNIVRGADHVTQLLVGLGRKVAGSNQAVDLRPAVINGGPGMLLMLDGRLDMSFSFDLDETGAIATFYMVRNPEKLTHLR